MAMTGFICHDDYYDRLKRLSDEEVGHLFRMLMLYHAGRLEEMESIGFIANEGIAFDFIRDDVDRMEEKTKKVEETKRINGSKGGRPKNQTEPTETESNQNKPTETEQNLTEPMETEQNLTEAYKDKDKDKYKDIERETILTDCKEKKPRFVPPTVEEIAEYCRERNNRIDPEYFFSYYQARDWILSNGRKVKDWKACVITWEKGDRRYGRTASNSGNSEGKVRSAYSFLDEQSAV